MNKTFKLYNARKEPMVIVNKKIDGSYRVLGLKGTQLSHVKSRNYIRPVFAAIRGIPKYEEDE